jgi:geranylgeranyl diphosphate synthase type I
MLHYHMGWADESLAPSTAPGGKRIRSTLCLLSCEALGGDWSVALPAAAAIELLHNFSLVHDDIEDGDPTRRGRPTLWSVWGVPQAINAGDALFAFAQLALLGLAREGVLPSRVGEAMVLFNNTCLAITEGQHLDIAFEQRARVPVADYLEMVARKTAALIAAACDLGALVASDQASDERTDAEARIHLRSFGRHLGMAFQMQDDILGIWGAPDITGKPAGADLARRKKSLPILHGLERSEELGAILARDQLDGAEVHRATELLEEVGSRAYAEALAYDHHRKAMQCLAATHGCPTPVEALGELANGLLGREQ